MERVLRSFAKHYAQGEPRLLQSTSPEAMAGWREACHSLHGACAAIGAQHLDQAVRDLDGARVGGADPASLAWRAAALHETLVQFVAQLAAALGPPGPA